MLLAAAGVRLDNSVDTRANLLATLNRGPALTKTAHSKGHLLSVAVDPATDRVATTAADGVGLELYDGRSLKRIAIRERVSAGSVFADPDGSGFAVSISVDQLKTGAEPPVLLLDRDGARAETQLGGFPQGYQVYDNFGFDPSSRWNMGYGPGGRWFTASLRDIGGTRPDLTLVWDLRSPRRPVARFALPDGKAPVVSADGHTLYSTSNDAGRLVVTNLPSGTTRRVLTAADLGVRQLDPVLVASPDGRTLAVGAGVEAVLVDAATLAPRMYVSGQGATSALAFSRNGTLFAATGDRLVVWDVSGAEPLQLLSQDGPVDDPQFSRDAATVFTKTYAGVLEAWDLEGTHRFIAARPVEHLAWKNGFDRISPDGQKVAYVQLGPRFRVRDLATGRLGPLVTTPMPQGSYLDIAWSPDGTLINMTTGDPVVRTWDSTTGRQLAQRRLAPPPSSEGAAIAFFSLDGKYLLLVGTTAGRIHVLDAHTLIPARAPIQVHALGSTRTGVLDVFDFTPSADLHTLYLNDVIVDYVTGTVRPWPDLGAKVFARFPSPDGRRLLVGTETGTGLLDAATMRWISPPNTAEAGFVGGGTRFSDDGSLVASVNNGRLSHWDGRTGAYLGSAAVDWDGDPVFSPDDRRLVFAGETGTVVSWNLDPRSWVAAACREAGRDLTPQEWRNYLPDRPFQSVCSS
jgi:WD40 repeat protein